ncbi:IS1595 family transposase ISSsu9 [Bacillus rhizoplanae]|uniref:Dihydrofolate reductase n=1 Tax=Bacillus rhizoplanae TaxID=2880966 RepID=A0ABN8A3R0_9BACI|nr:dihydrofolate reductase [Bacillus rhizoplanae]CAG9613681.1 IS1595 family transposase ISSsu9 [Bacillus rhizoplanae]
MISLLVAMDKNRLIGKDNQLPWHLPADLAYFKKVTMGHPIIMGRKTFESIGKPLPGRTNIILTRNKNYEMEGCEVIYSIDDVQKMDEQLNEEIFVIGGAEIFKEVLPFADRLYITKIEEVFEGDTFFPEINYNEWKEISVEQGVTDEKNPYTYAYHVYGK